MSWSNKERTILIATRLGRTSERNCQCSSRFEATLKNWVPWSKCLWKQLKWKKSSFGLNVTVLSAIVAKNGFIDLTLSVLCVCRQWIWFAHPLPNANNKWCYILIVFVLFILICVLCRNRTKQNFCPHLTFNKTCQECFIVIMLRDHCFPPYSVHRENPTSSRNMEAIRFGFQSLVIGQRIAFALNQLSKPAQEVDKRTDS